MPRTNIDISRKDIAWSYTAKFFSLATSLIIMPFVLHMLSPEEVGMNYLMATVSSIVMLIDFGFGPQFGRNFSYVSSGAQALLKEGVEHNESGEVNYRLLAVLLKTARKVYSRLSLAALAIMLTAGTAYIYFVTDGFVTVSGSLWIWLIYSVSVFFNFYYSYYTTLLTGSGMIAESSKATILTRVVQIVLNVTMLYMGFGLFSVVIANLLAPFVQRFYCYKVYFTPELKAKTAFEITKEEISETFRTIWYNARRMGINLVGSYAINKLGLFLVGLFLPLAVSGSFGLLIQLSTIISGVAVILANSYMPVFSNYRVTGQTEELKGLFSFSMLVYWVIIIAGTLAVVFLGEPALSLIHSKTHLPAASLCAVYLIIVALEGNHGLFATLITTKNQVPFVEAGLISGGIIALLTFLSLKFTSLGLWGVVLVQGIVQLCYNNWYWPRWVLKDLDVSLPRFVQYGFNHLKTLKNGKGH